MTGKFAVGRPVGKRRVVRALNGETAKKALAQGGFGPGREVFGFTKGQFSIIDVIAALTDICGPVDATIATWTAAMADMSHIETWLAHHTLTSVRWIVDHSFMVRQPDLCDHLRATFGDACIRACESHAKFVLLANTSWRIVVQTSMNLNHNKRIENFWVADDPELFRAYADLVDQVFAATAIDFAAPRRTSRAMLQTLGVEQRVGFFSLADGRDLI